MTDSSITSSTSIQDSSPISCWQGSSIASRRLSTSHARRRCTATGSSFKESEVDNQLHKNDNLKTQNAQEEYPETRQKAERILGPKTSSRILHTKKRIQSHHGATVLKQGALTKKEGNNSIHFNASTESLSIISKLLESANIRCILFAIRNYLDDLQQGNFLFKYIEEKDKRNFLPRPKERSPWRTPR